MTGEFSTLHERGTPQQDKLGVVMRHYLLDLFQTKKPKFLSKRQEEITRSVKEGQTGLVFDDQFAVTINGDLAKFLRIIPHVSIELSTTLKHIQTQEKYTTEDYYYIGVEHKNATWYKDTESNLLWTPDKSYAALIHTEPSLPSDVEPAHIWYADTKEKLLTEISRRDQDVFPEKHIPLGDNGDDSSATAQLWITYLLQAVAQATGTEKKFKAIENQYIKPSN